MPPSDGSGDELVHVDLCAGRGGWQAATDPDPRWTTIGLDIVPMRGVGRVARGDAFVSDQQSGGGVQYMLDDPPLWYRVLFWSMCVVLLWIFLDSMLIFARGVF